MDGSPPGSSVHGILQARILECITIPFSGGSSWPRDWIHVFCIAGRFFMTETPEKPQRGLMHGRVRRHGSRDPTLKGHGQNLSCSETQCRSSDMIEAWGRPTCWSWRAAQRGRRQLYIYIYIYIFFFFSGIWRINIVKMSVTILFYTIQCNLQTQCNFYQITSGISHRIKTQNFTICMGTQMTLDS